MIFLFDENISPRAAHMLTCFDEKHELRAFEDYFMRGTRDVEWLRVAGEWDEASVAVVAGDGRILRNKVERQALKECRLTFVYLAPAWMHLCWHEFAWKIVRVWPDVVRNVEQAPHPLLFEVSPGGKLRTLGRISNL